MQLGVAHALVVADARPPDVVAGISTGAIQAAALAEVLQTEAKAEDPRKRRLAQLNRLGQFVGELEAAPEALLHATLPDAYEVNAAKALQPLELPIHFDRERHDRLKEANARAGLTRLMNHLLRLDLRVSTITIAVRRVLGIRAAAEDPSFLSRWAARIWAAVWLYLLAWGNLLRLAHPVGQLSWALLVPHPPSARRTTAGAIVQRRLLRAAGRGLTAVVATIWTVVLLSLAPLALLCILGGRAGRDAWTRWRGRPRVTAWRKLLNRLLGRYGIRGSLAQAHALRSILVRLFDREHYGKVVLSRAVDRALRRDEGSQECGASDERGQSRRLSSFHERDSAPIYVAPMAADLANGKLVEIAQEEPIVDALLGATALVPLFPAQKVLVSCAGGTRSSRHVVDGSNVANEPISALIDVLRQRITKRSAQVRLFPVAHFPFSQETLGGDRSREYHRTLGIIRRVLQLRHFRDATLERRLVELYTRLLGKGDAVETIQCDEEGSASFLRARVQPIEPAAPLELNARWALAAGPEQRSAALRRAVADGCRATLETILGPELVHAPPADPAPDAGEPVRSAGSPTVLCAVALALRQGLSRSDRHLAQLRPGLHQVCNECDLGGRADAGYAGSAEPPNGGASGQSATARRLAVRDTAARGKETWSWPRWTAGPDEGHAKPSEADPPSAAAVKTEALRPAGHAERPKPEGDPLSCLLLSGGVFRGVFQVGVLAGLSEADVRPHVVAGASVGSILAGMAASVFAEPATRRKRLAFLASTFLALDRLILTDRFADAVRSLTLRGAASGFSPRDMDKVFRRYDDDRPLEMSRRARRVVAGLERLLYLSPFELQRWLDAARHGDGAALCRLLDDDLQELLDRLAIGHELLGAEPLRLLIRGHGHPGEDQTLAEFHSGDGRGCHVIAVATNLTEGRLEILPDTPEDARKFRLEEALLASSAFPFVFRPRRAWELRSDQSGTTQYVDGGVMDNLPLDAVAKFLDHASRPQAGRPGDAPPVPRRPRAPHLLLAASLEPQLEELGPDAAGSLARNWVDVRERARRLRYNGKIETYAKAQRHFRMLYELLPQPDGGFVPLDIEVVAVKPRWLCGTFGFHPMLGFRRRRQAESIAHGCASTLATLRSLERDPRTRRWASAWGVKLQDFDLATIGDGSLAEESEFDPVGPPPALHPRKGGKRDTGKCWFRHDSRCPFSLQSLRAKDGAPGGLTLEAKEEIATIHAVCGDWRTHVVH